MSSVLKLYRVFIKYCVFFSEDFEIILSLFSLCVNMCTPTRQVEHQRCSRTGRVQKKSQHFKKNTIFNEHPVPPLFKIVRSKR